MMLDHLVYAVPNLDAAIDELQERTGVRPERGGSHPGRGTQNALLGLGVVMYLEIIGPDAAQPGPAEPWLGIDESMSPRLATWAAKSPDIDAQVAHAKAAGYDPGPVVAGNRRRPDGSMLEWRLTVRPEPAGSGLVPFLIDWGLSDHPSKAAPRGCRLTSLSAVHPRAASVSATLGALRVSLTVVEGHPPALIAVLDTPRGSVELR
jgi:hypothetical protein